MLGTLVLAFSAVVLPASEANALSKTVNGITVDVNLPHAQRGVAYEFQILPSGQSAPYRFDLVAGSLPEDFTLSSTGVVSGLSCSAPNGTYKFAVRITAANSVVAEFSGTRQFSMNMTRGPCREDEEQEDEPADSEEAVGEGEAGNGGPAAGSDESGGTSEPGDTGGTNDPGDTDEAGGADGNDPSEPGTGGANNDPSESGAGVTNNDPGEPGTGGSDDPETSDATPGDGNANPGNGDATEVGTGADDSVVGGSNTPGAGGTNGPGTGGGEGSGGDGSEAPADTVPETPIRAADGEIIIDLSSSPQPSGSIDLASLTTSASVGDPVTFEIAGQPGNGSVSLSGSVITYVPSAGASRDTLQFVATQGSTRSNLATVAVRIIRAQVSADPALPDVVRDQVDAAASAGFLQLNNIASHLETSAWGEDCALKNSVRLRSASGNPTQDTHAPKALSKDPKDCAKSTFVKAWATGVVTVDDDRGSISTDGLTAGIEVSLGSKTTAGVAAGLSRSKFGADEETRSGSKSLSLAVYSHWRPARLVHLSGAFGYADLNLELRRELGATDEVARSKRNGRVWFGMARAAAEARIGSLTVAAYSRGGFASVRLDATTEQTDHPLGIRFSSVRNTQFDGALGGTVRHTFAVGDGLLTPFARVEQRWISRGALVQELGYSDTPGERQSVRAAGRSTGTSLLGAGARYQAGSVTFLGEYRMSSDSALGLGNGHVRIELSTSF